MAGDLRTARIAVATIFGGNGAVFATWSIHIPTVQRNLALSEGALGATLLVMALGSIGVMPFVGGLIARLSSRLITRITALAMVLLMPALILIPDIWLLLLTLILFGAANGALDVAMNAQAVAIETRYARPILSSFHAWFSIGGVVGALGGSALLGLGITPAQHAVLVGGGLGLIMLVAGSFLLYEARDEASTIPTFILPRGILLPLGMLALCDLIAEGAMIDWSAVYLRNWLGTSPALAGLGFAAFSLMMSLGRLTGDALIARFDRIAVLRWSGWFAAVGLFIGLVLPHPFVAIAGFGCVGLGLANVIPILFNAAGRVPGIAPGVAIAAVTTTGYSGFFIGPPLIGWTAEAFNLPIAMGLVVLCCAIVAWWSPRILHTISSQDATTTPAVIER